ncbi:MAG: hypothetical protein MSA68_05685, partial [Helicobacter sp.]|nr:hypothetical protein [Helicobacter sp.]
MKDKNLDLGMEIVGMDRMQVKMKEELKVKKVDSVDSKVKVDSKARVGSVDSKARVVKGRKTLKQSRNFIPKFISTIAALSLCVSSAVAHHPQKQTSGTNNKWIPLKQTGLDYDNKHTGNSETVTINNDGKPVSGMLKVEKSGGTLQSLITKGTINGANQIINIESGKNVYVPTITNKGMLNGNTSNGGNTGKKGVVEVQGKSTIANFTNSGTIKASNNNAVFLKESTIETFINEGLIQGESNGGNLKDGTVHGAIYLHENGNTTIKSFDNKGTIKAKRAGIFIVGSKNTTITHLKNSGVIEITNGSNSNGKDDSAGIVLAQLNTVQGQGSKPIYDTIENTGIIKGGNYGMFIEGGTISNLKNSGTIEGKKDGIAFFNAGGPLQTTITNLEIEQGGIVKGGENGINLSRIEFDRRNGSGKGEQNDRIVENLIIREGARVEGADGSGLVLGKVEDKRNNGKQAQQSDNKDTYKLTGKIEVNGTLKGKTAGITNYRDMGTEGKEVIVIGEHGKIEGVVKNESGGTLKGNITNNGSHELAIDNQGKTGNNTVITNNGSGEIKIKDWKLENQGNGSSNLKTVKFEGKNISVDKLTINAQNIDITKVANAFSTDNNASKADIFANTQVKVSGDNGAVTITGDLLRGLVANIDGSKTAAAALNRTLIATATARATFLDTVMGNALNTLSF